MPKYKNSPESDYFKKSLLWYGLFELKQYIARKNECFIVEGQHDVLQLFEKNIPNVVAGSGTALSEGQINQVMKFTQNITLLLDADKAGINAAMKDISPILKKGANLKIIVLPENEDPDSFAASKSTAEILNYFEENKQDFILFKTNILKEETEKDPFKTSQLLSEIINDISIIPSKEARRIYTKQCAKVFDISENELSADVQKLRHDIKDQDIEIFAWDEAKNSIKETGIVYLSVDFDTVVNRHLANKQNFIGISEQIKPTKLKVLLSSVNCKTIIIDDYVNSLLAGKTSETEIITISKYLFSNGFDVRVNTTLEYFEGIDINEETGEVSEYPGTVPFIDLYIFLLRNEIKPYNSDFHGTALERAAEILSFLPESSRITKINSIVDAFKAQKLKFSIGDFKKLLNIYLKKNARQDDRPQATIDSSNKMNLNDEQIEDLNRYQHYYDKKGIFHLSRTGQILKISNFTIIPIIHSNTSNGHFKLFEMKNEYGQKTAISLDTKDLNDVRRFKCKIEEKGNYIFKGQQLELDNIKERLYANTTYASEIENLGWQSEGFWAWSVGVTNKEGKFIQTDKNGLIKINESNFLIKPNSNLYIDDKTAYINEKKFNHKISNISFKEWSELYVKVFGDNAKISVCTLLTSIYSDAIFKTVHGELPLINYFGPKGTGKTQHAESLLAFFGDKQPINNLSKVTVYGLSQTLKSFHNALCLIDEYKNSIDIKFIELLKSVYNRQGKIQGNISKEGTKTEHIPINQMVLLCGQDMPTLDVALLERCLCLTSYKNEYTDEEKNEYKTLKNIEESGLAHLTDEFIKKRDIVIEQFAEKNAEIQNEISQACPSVSVRLQKNLTTVLTPFKILEKHFDFPFTYSDVMQVGVKIIREQQKFIENSDDIKNFWSIFLTLVEQKRIKEGRNYILHDVQSITYVDSYEQTQYRYGKNILFLRWDGLYPLYAEYSKRSGMIALSEGTIKFYLTKAKYYTGRIKTKKFRDKDTKEEWVNQAFCFDFNMMDISLNQSVDIELDNINMTPSNTIDNALDNAIMKEPALPF
jgi:DNA primase